MEPDRARQLNALYDSIRAKSINTFLSGGAADGWLNQPETDTRMAVALVIRPPEVVRGRIRRTLDEIAKNFPELYFYPANGSARHRAGHPTGPLRSAKALARPADTVQSLHGIYRSFTGDVRHPLPWADFQRWCPDGTGL